MKYNKLFAALLSASLCILPGVAIPDDIDLYTGGETLTGAETNVLIFLDNSANWSNASGWPATQGEAELNALKTVIDTLNDTVNVGVMMHTSSGSTSAAYVRFAMRPMNAKNRKRLKELFDDIKSTAPNAPQDKVSQSQDGDASVEEAFRYFNSLAKGYNLTDSKQDYPGNTDYYSAGGGVSAALASKSHPGTASTILNDMDDGTALGSYAYSGASATSYSGPSSSALGCAKNYLIWIGNTSLSGATDGTRLSAAATAVGTTANTAQIAAISGASGASAPPLVMLDEWTRFMYEKGVKTTIADPDHGGTYWNNIKTYTVDVFPKAGVTDPVTCTAETAGGAQQVGQHFIMESTARAGGGKCYPATNTTQLAQALQAIFAEIQSINSVFASATLPVSVNTQGTYENQVYIGVFRPDGFARPRWYGNLKEYKFARYCDANNNDVPDNVGSGGDERIDGNSSPPSCTGDTLKLFLSDRNNKPAIDNTLGTGFISLQATSYWSAASTFWSFTPDPIAGSSDVPDGPAVERGGAAYRLRTLFPLQTAASGIVDIDHRKVYTCMGNCLSPTATTLEKSLSNNPFSTSNSDVTTRLANIWPMSPVSLSRTGNTVTVTTPSAHGLGAGNTITISGTGVSDYDQSHAVVSGSGTTLTFTVPEKPLDDTSGNAVVSTSATSVAIYSVTVNTAGNLATVTTASPHPFVTGDTIVIGGASSSFLNGSKIITSTGSNTFTYPVTWTIPASPATVAGSTSFGAPVNQGNANTSLSIPDMTQPTLVMGRWSAQVPATGNPKVAVGTTQLTVSGTTPSAYSGTYTLYETGSSCPGTSALTNTQAKSVYCYKLVNDETGAGLTATKNSGTTANISITRSGTTATAVLTASNTLPPGTASITISGASQTEYNGTKAITLDPALDRFTFAVSVSPPVSASGSATVPNIFSASASSLIAWMRGVDNHDDENNNGSNTDVRASIHGDVLHSRPLLINYGGTTGIVGFYGSNDGYLRAIKGGINDTDGGEKWAFIPDEFVSKTKLGRLYNNSEAIRFPNSNCPAGGAVSPSPRNYFWDGQLTAYQTDDLATTYIFAGMRRGGRSLYALDVSNPDVPKLMWRITSDMADYTYLGQTWSEPKVAWIKDVSQVSGKRLVLIFGAGYNAIDEDKQPGAVRGGSTSGVGRGVYVVDALTGQRIQFIEANSAVKYSFAADVSVFDSDGDGFIDRIYAVDTGAQIFRFDYNAAVDPTDASAWVRYQLANFGDTAHDGGDDARKFLFPPEIVPFSYDNQSTGTRVNAVMVLVGSGDREKPLPNKKRNGTANAVSCPALYSDSYFGDIVHDRFYALIDSTPSLALTAPAVVTEANRMWAVNVDSNNLAQYNLCYGFETNCSRGGASNPIYNGWMIDLKSDPDGLGYGEEKLVSAPRVVSGLVLFGTNTPETPNLNPPSGQRLVCQNLGQARAYALSPFTGLPAFDRNGDHRFDQNDFAAVITGGGLPPSVTAGVVGISGGNDGSGDTSYYRFVIGGGGSTLSADSPISGAKNPITLRGVRSRVYWYYPVDEK